jgi:hypothetical protein
MASRIPGPICSSQLGPEWIDPGTMCRSRTCPPGPPGLEPPHIPIAARLASSLVMGAAPKKPKRLPGEKSMLADDIDRIAVSPFGRTATGEKVVRLLRRLDAQDGIVYGETDGDARGEFYGTGITVRKDYYGNACKTILELVHEASHMLWRAEHPIRKGKMESVQEATDNELYVQENQLAIYTWLKDELGWPPDPDMDLRQKRQAKGTLRSTIEANIRAERNE